MLALSVTAMLGRPRSCSGFKIKVLVTTQTPPLQLVNSFTLYCRFVSTTVKLWYNVPWIQLALAFDVRSSEHEHSAMGISHAICSIQRTLM